MSQNPPVRLVISDEFYEAIAQRNANINADRAANGLPPIPWEPSYISESQARAEDAQREKHASNAAKLAPPPPARGPLCRAARAKLAERNASIPGFDRHSRKCQICRSPYVDFIEQVYLQWERVDSIRGYFRLADADTLYRHARAAGLDVLRRQNSRWVIEQFIEQWRSVKISSATIIRSIRALSCLDDKGHWTDLPKTHIFVRSTDARREPENGSLPPDTLQTQDDDVSLSLQTQKDDVPLSFEHSEPHHGYDSCLPRKAVTSSTGGPIAATTASDTSIPEAGSEDVSFSSRPSAIEDDDVPFSFERSEPQHGRNSGFRGTNLPEMEPSTVFAPSSERSEPHKNSSADFLAPRRGSSAQQEDAPLSSERSEPFAEGEF